jgi:hypothetical protein
VATKKAVSISETAFHFAHRAVDRTNLPDPSRVGQLVAIGRSYKTQGIAAAPCLCTSPEGRSCQLFQTAKPRVPHSRARGFFVLSASANTKIGSLIAMGTYKRGMGRRLLKHEQGRPQKRARMGFRKLILVAGSAPALGDTSTPFRKYNPKQVQPPAEFSCQDPRLGLFLLRTSIPDADIQCCR